MNPRNTAILFCLAGALFAFIFFYERNQHHAQNEVERVMPGFKASEVTGIHVYLPEQEIDVELTNHEWQITKPISYPAQSALITNLLQSLVNFAPTIRLTAQDLQGHADVNKEYGLDHPQATVVFQQGSQQRQIKFGTFTAPGDQIYAEVVGMDGVDILDSAFFKNLIPRNANDWRQTSLLNGLPADFTGLSIAGGSQPLISFQLQRASTNALWQMIKPVETRADNSKVNAALTQLQGLQIAGFVSDSASADLDSYGLHPPLMEIGFLRGTNRLLGVQIGKLTTDTNFLYARFTGQPAIFALPREGVAPWLAGFQEFRDRHLVRFFPAAPESITIEGEENVQLQRQTDDSWKATDPKTSETLVADSDVLAAFFGSLTNMQVVQINSEVAVKDTVPPDAASLEVYGLAKPVRRYTLRVSKDDLPPGVTNDVLAALDFGAVRDEVIFVRRSDLPAETSVYAVALKNFYSLPWRAIHFQKRHIWQFSEDDVLSITLRQNGVSQKVLRKGTAKWSFAEGSQGVMNELEMEVGAQELGSLDAQEWRQAGDANASQYGLGNNDTRFVIEVKGKQGVEQKVLDIGSKDQNGLHYASVMQADGRNWIFTIPQKAYDRLEAYFKLQDNPGR